MSRPSILTLLEADGRRVSRIRLRSAARPEDRPEHLGPPPTCERYDLLEEIGRGGSGVVLRSRDSDLGRDVAMKVLHQGLVRNPDVVRHFVEEARIGGQLQHPGIVPVHELGLNAERAPYFTMKLVEGETLSSILAARRDPADERRRVLQVFVQMCQTVAYAHSRGVIHRDLKPSNVMIGAFGEVQLVDWGLAKVLGEPPPSSSHRQARPVTQITTLDSDSGSSLSRTGSVMGTPAYMSPEQARGQVNDLDERTDVFALGAILCEILTGRPPYTKGGGDLLEQARAAQLDEARERLGACDADPELVNLARQCLAEQADARPRNGAAVGAIASQHLANAADRARRSELRSIEERARAARSRARVEEARLIGAELRRARRQTLALAGASLLAVVVAAGTWLAIESGRSSRARRAALTVEEAMQEAHGQMGAGEWTAALAAAERATELARGGAVEATLKGQAAALLADVEDAALRAEEAAALAAQDDAVLARLEALGIRQQLLDAEPGVTDAAYTEAFQGIGIDLERLGIDEAAEQLRSRSRPAALCAALDVWSGLYRTGGGLAAGTGRRLLEIARAADPEPLRAAVRDAARDEDLDALRELTDRGEEAAIPTPSVSLLAMMLTDLGDPAAAAELLRDQLFEQPAALGIHCQLARAARRAGSPPRGEILRELSAALALRPDSAELRVALGEALAQRDRQEEALAAFEDAADLAPEWAEPRFRAGALHYGSGRYAEARESLETADTLAPLRGDPRIWLYLALADARLGDVETGWDWFDMAVSWLDEHAPEGESLKPLVAEVETLLEQSF